MAGIEYFNRQTLGCCYFTMRGSVMVKSVGNVIDDPSSNYDRFVAFTSL